MIKPIGERVLLKIMNTEEKTKGGIYLPKDDRRKHEGEVIELGQFKNDVSIKIGDKVIYSGYGNEEIEANGEKFVIVEYKDIIAKLD